MVGFDWNCELDRIYEVMWDSCQQEDKESLINEVKLLWGGESKFMWESHTKGNSLDEDFVTKE